MEKFGLFHIIESVPYAAKCTKWLPPPWKKTESVLIEGEPVGKCFTLKAANLYVISSLDTMEDGKKYLHVSLSLPKRIPNWDMVKNVKNRFIGKDKDAFIYFPPESEYLNLMPFCLHLWHEVREDEI